MKILVIWNNDASGFVEDLRKAFKNQKGKELDENDIKVINKWSDFTPFLDSFNNATSSIPDHIFILVELNWNRKKLMGYQIALQIMKANPPHDKGIDLQFVSAFSRDYLYDKTIGSAVNHYLVKVFEHYQYPESTSFVFNKCSKNIWNYYRKHVLSKSLILANIKHRLDSVSIQTVIPELLSLSDILDKKTLSFIDSFNKNIKTESDIEELKLLLENRANELNNELNIFRETKKRSYNVLIIEDDEDWLRRLESIFKSRYESVRCYTSGQEALQELKDNSHRYDILVADLDLLDKDSGYKYYQKTMGFHLVEYAERYCKHLAIRIITSLSSVGIDILFPQKNLKILPKRNYTFINDDYFDELEKDVILALKCNRNKKGPINSLWVETNMQGGQGGNLLNYYYNVLTDKDREDIWQFAYENIDNLHQIPGGLKPEEEKNLIKRPIENVIGALKTIFTNRIYWISKGYKSEGVIKNNVLYFEKLDNKNHTSQWGFRVLRNQNQQYTIVFGFLFPEEIFWIKNEGWTLKIEHTYLKETIDDICEDFNLKKPKRIMESYLSFLDYMLIKIESLSEKDRQLFLGSIQDFKAHAPEEWISLDSSIQSKLESLLM